jgi:hypothetical protein
MCLNSSRLLKSLWTPGIGIQNHLSGQLPWIRSWRNCNGAGKPSKTSSRDAPCRVHEKGGKNNSSRLGDTTLGLRWQDCDFASGEIRLLRGIVRQRETLMKTEASRKPVPLGAGLADVLMQWRTQCMYNQPGDYLFASPEKDGKQPMWPNSAMEKHIRPAAIRAGIGKRIGWHVFRHSFGTLVKSQGADVATTQALMRHANVSVTMDRYVQAIGEAKRTAQRGIVDSLFPSVPAQVPAEPVSH